MADGEKSPSDLAVTVAYCGLVCGVCRPAMREEEACVGCRNGGGDKGCHQRHCCTSKGLDGCWECEEFPCDDAFIADDDDPAWRGLCIGSVQCVIDYGKDGYVERLLSTVGDVVEYGEYRYRSPEEIRLMLCGGGA